MYILLILASMKLLLPRKSSRGSVGKGGTLVLFLVAAGCCVLGTTSASRPARVAIVIAALGAATVAVALIRYRSPQVDAAEAEVAAESQKALAEVQESMARINADAHRRSDSKGRRGLAASMAQEVEEQQARWR